MKTIALFLLMILSSNFALADCDFSTGITKLADGGYRYTEPCHLKVGQLVQDNKVQIQQIADLTKAITLKDLAITNADARTALWQTTSENMETRLQKLDISQKSSDWIMFSLGALTVIGSGFMAARLIK